MFSPGARQYVARKGKFVEECSAGELELEVTLDRQLYHHGDDVR